MTRTFKPTRFPKHYSPGQRTVARSQPQYRCPVCLREVARTVADRIACHVDTIQQDCCGAGLPWRTATKVKAP